MSETFARVSRLGKQGLIVWIPQKESHAFSPGDFVLLRKVTPSEVENA